MPRRARPRADNAADDHARELNQVVVQPEVGADDGVEHGALPNQPSGPAAAGMDSRLRRDTGGVAAVAFAAAYVAAGGAGVRFGRASVLRYDRTGTTLWPSQRSRQSVTPPDPPTAAGVELLGIEIGGTKLQIVAGVTTPGRSSAAGARRSDRTRVAKASAGRSARAEQARAGRKFGRDRRRVRRADRLGGPAGSPGRTRSAAGMASTLPAGWPKWPGSRSRSIMTPTPGALDEATRGAVPALDPVFYVTLGSGVGGGLVAGGRIYHGAPPGEAEFGICGWTATAPPSNPVVQAGRSTGASAGSEKRDRPACSPARSPNRPPAARHASSWWPSRPATRMRGSPLDALAQDLAFALSGMVHLVHPQVIVLGGGLSLVGEPLTVGGGRPITRICDAGVPPNTGRGPCRAVREDAVPVGALALARRRISVDSEVTC